MPALMCTVCYFARNVLLARQHPGGLAMLGSFRSQMGRRGARSSRLSTAKQVEMIFLVVTAEPLGTIGSLVHDRPLYSSLPLLRHPYMHHHGLKKKKRRLYGLHTGTRPGGILCYLPLC